MNKDDLTILNDRLADVLVVLKGFKAGILSNPNGNQEQRKELLNLVDYINENLLTSKQLISKTISQ